MGFKNQINLNDKIKDIEKENEVEEKLESIDVDKILHTYRRIFNISSFGTTGIPLSSFDITEEAQHEPSVNSSWINNAHAYVNAMQNSLPNGIQKVDISENYLI